jgi:NADH-quinone oxidoreductase subunit G
VFPKGEAREGWAIWRAVSALIGKPLPYDDLAALRAALMRDHPTFAGVDYAPGAATTLDLTAVGKPADKDPFPLKSPITDFHLTNPIARASTVMAECSAARKAATAPVRHAAE